MIPTVVLIGPTAVGKSRIALALAQRFRGEIVSADSAQVYRGMDVGTAKPDVAMRTAIAHHLIDLIDPTDAYSAARFRADAMAAIDAIRKRGHLPIVVGGTMLYVKALREGLSALPSADSTIRAMLDARAARIGWPAMHEELARIDAETAARLAPTDAQRIQRALEVHALTGRPLSALQGAREGRRTIDPTIVAALAPVDRAQLHAAIARRFDAMLETGLVDEVRELRARFELRSDMPSMRAVGYRQTYAYLDGRMNRAELRERGIAATRQLAKRQITWLRAMNVETTDCFAASADASVVTRVERALQGTKAPL